MGIYSFQTMEYNIYLDESGDLGWRLEHPYRRGGSSKYFTIGYMLIPVEKLKHIKRFIKKFHSDRGGKEKEIKGADLRIKRAESLSRSIIELFEWNNDIVLGSITAFKQNAPKRIVHSSNDEVLYNHMVTKAICSKVALCDKVNFIPDERSVPRGSQNSCFDMIKNELWLKQHSEAELSFVPGISKKEEGLMFVDWIANFVWRHYEDNNSNPYFILSKYLQEDTLFF